MLGGARIAGTLRRLATCSIHSSSNSSSRWASAWDSHQLRVGHSTEQFATNGKCVRFGTGNKQRRLWCSFVSILRFQLWLPPCPCATLRCFSAVFGAKLAISAARRDKLFILCQVLRTHCPAPLPAARSKLVLVWWVPCGAVCGVLSQTVGGGTSRETAPAFASLLLLLFFLYPSLLLLLSSRGSPIGWHYLRPAGNISVSVRVALPVCVCVCVRKCRLCVASTARQTQIKSASKVFAPRATLHRWVTCPHRTLSALMHL